MDAAFGEPLLVAERDEEVHVLVLSGNLEDGWVA